MKRTTLMILAAAAMLTLAGPGPSRAGTEITLRIPVVDGLQLSLGLRIESRSISLDGILSLEDDARDDFPGSAGGQTKLTVHRVRFGDYPNFFKTARTCFLAARAVQQSASRMTKHWFECTILKENQTKGSGDADSR